jgi:hypothetical protein
VHGYVVNQLDYGTAELRQLYRSPKPLLLPDMRTRSCIRSIADEIAYAPSILISVLDYTLTSLGTSHIAEYGEFLNYSAVAAM